MSIRSDYINIGYERIYEVLYCSYCGKQLGKYQKIKDKEYSDIKDWKFCPFCGEEL